MADPHRSVVVGMVQLGAVCVAAASVAGRELWLLAHRDSLGLWASGAALAHDALNAFVPWLVVASGAVVLLAGRSMLWGPHAHAHARRWLALWGVVAALQTLSMVMRWQRVSAADWTASAAVAGLAALTGVALAVWGTVTAMRWSHQMATRAVLQHHDQRVRDALVHQADSTAE